MDILHFKVKNSGKNIFFLVEGGIFFFAIIFLGSLPNLEMEGGE